MTPVAILNATGQLGWEGGFWLSEVGGSPAFFLGDDVISGVARGLSFVKWANVCFTDLPQGPNKLTLGK